MTAGVKEAGIQGRRRSNSLTLSIFIQTGIAIYSYILSLITPAITIDRGRKLRALRAPVLPEELPQIFHKFIWAVQGWKMSTARVFFIINQRTYS